jgi:hypothetical protein
METAGHQSRKRGQLALHIQVQRSEQNQQAPRKLANARQGLCFFSICTSHTLLSHFYVARARTPYLFQFATHKRPPEILILRLDPNFRAELVFSDSPSLPLLDLRARPISSTSVPVNTTPDSTNPQQKCRSTLHPVSPAPDASRERLTSVLPRRSAATSCRPLSPRSSVRSTT